MSPHCKIEHAHGYGRVAHVKVKRKKSPTHSEQYLAWCTDVFTAGYYFLGEEGKKKVRWIKLKVLSV